MFSTISAGSSRITMSCAKKPIVFTRKLFFRKQDRAGFGHAKRRTDDRNVNIGGLRPASEVLRYSVTGILRNRRTDGLRVRESFPQESFEISRRLGHHFSVEFFQRRSKL